MQYMEFFAVRHDTGAALPYAAVQAFPAGGTSAVQLYGEMGQALGTQASADALGRVGVALPFGAYDLQITAGAYSAPKLSGVTFGEPMAAGLFTDIAGLFIPPTVSVIQTTGHSTAGVGVARYAATTTTGVTAWRVQSADGRWWKLAEPAPDVSMFGALGDGVTDDTAALNAAIAYAGPPVVASQAQGGGVVRIRSGMVVRITAQVYLNPFVVIEGDLGAGGFFEDFTPGQTSGAGILADFDFTAGGAIEAVGFVTATSQRISPTTYINGAQVDAGTYGHLTGTGLRNLFVYTTHANAFCPIRFVGAPQWVLDNVTVQGFWHGPIANASWAGRVPALFSRCLYSGLILDQDSNGCSLGSLYLSGDLAGMPSIPVPNGCAFPNWPTYGLTDPNSQPANANLSRTGLCVFAGDPVPADVLILEGWNVAANVYSSGLSAKVFECESISDHVLTAYASRVTVDNLFAYVPGLNLAYLAVGADVKLGIPEWVSGFFASPLQYRSPYANNFEVEGTPAPTYPYLGREVIYRQLEDNPYNDVYVDVTAGSDAGLGCTASAPLQTFLEALFRARPDKTNRIFLQQGQTIQTIAEAQFHDNGAVLEDIAVQDCRMELHGYTPASGTTTRPVLVAGQDSSNIHTNGLILTRSSLLFQDVDFQVMACTGTPEGYNAGLYIQGTCDVRFAGASTVQIESGTNPVALFQPWYGRSGVLTWSLEDTASVGRYPGSAAAGYLGLSSYAGQGRMALVAGSINSSATTPIDAGIRANGYSGASYTGGVVSQA